jgi:hypothetical protein
MMRLAMREGNMNKKKRGLESSQKALDELKKGVSGVKFVHEV